MQKPAKNAERRTNYLIHIAVAVSLLVIGVIIFVTFIRPITAARQKLELLNEFRIVALLYHGFHSEMGRAPTGLDELRNHKSESVEAQSDLLECTNAFEMIERGDFIMIWDAQFFFDGNRNDDFLLGREREAAKSGGIVMLAGGSVHHMSATEFNGFPKIPTTTSK